MKKSNKKGFTLVELVIVIAVIAILAAVLIPTFAGIIEKANISAAEQEARNAYTSYAIEAAETENLEPKLCVEVTKNTTKYYVYLTNGGVDSTKDTTTTAPTFVKATADEDATKTTESVDGYKHATIVSGKVVVLEVDVAAE